MDNGTQKETRCCLWWVSGGRWGRDSLVEMNTSTSNSRLLFRSKWMIVLKKKNNNIFFTDVNSPQVMLGAVVEKYYDMKPTYNEQQSVINLHKWYSSWIVAEELRQAIIQLQFSKVRFYWGCQVKKKKCVGAFIWTFINLMLLDSDPPQCWRVLLYKAF